MANGTNTYLFDWFNLFHEASDRFIYYLKQDQFKYLPETFKSIGFLFLLFVGFRTLKPSATKELSQISSKGGALLLSIGNITRKKNMKQAAHQHKNLTFKWFIILFLYDSERRRQYMIMCVMSQVSRAQDSCNNN